MQAPIERKWTLVKASILVAFALAAAGLAVSMPGGTQPPAGTQVAAIPAEDKVPSIDDFVDVPSPVRAAPADQPVGQSDTF